MGRPCPHVSRTLDFYRDAGRSRLWVDRAGLDALFASRHPGATGHAVPLIERRVLRADQPVILLVADTARPPPQATTLRFC